MRSHEEDAFPFLFILAKVVLWGQTSHISFIHQFYCFHENYFVQLLDERTAQRSQVLLLVVDKLLLVVVDSWTGRFLSTLCKIEIDYLSHVHHV